MMTFDAHLSAYQLEIAGYFQGFLAQFLRSYLAIGTLYGLFVVPLIVIYWQFRSYSRTGTVVSLRVICARPFVSTQSLTLACGSQVSIRASTRRPS